MAQFCPPVVGRLLLACLALIAACGGDTEADLTVDQFVSEYLRQVCDSFVNCGVMPDQDTCRSSFKGTPDFSTLQAEVMASRVDFDGKSARACLSHLTDDLQRCSVFSEPSAEVRSACEAVFTGHLASGAACYFDDQCQAGSVCDQSGSGACASACCVGVCKTVAAEIPLGQACTGDDKCVAGGYCLVLQGVGTCTQKIASPGAACTISGACEPPLVCAPDFARAMPVFTLSCLRPGETGADCSEGAATYCKDLRDHCDPSSHRCERLPAVGAPCAPGPTESLIGACALGADCDSQTSTCKARGKIGDPCDDGAADVGCLLTLVCSSATKTCQPESTEACPAP